MARVISVHRQRDHQFSKSPEQQITLIAGEGVQGDAHRGQTVKHRSRVARDPDQPNLRQVHLLHEELLDELRTQSFRIHPGDIGENILTRDLALLDLPEGTLLRIGEQAKLRITGLRNPCRQLNDFAPGLTDAVLARGPQGELVRKAGVMAVVENGGVVKAGDAISTELPENGKPLEPV
ncbi:MOSC domain-containing protein [Parasphingorhabdus marina DSM 22363]|uniref:MOSC domain-containing protein n=1 Tax=Parasphingorhabdus marina DSM 22363 TaxID=1123272 RepID=A0A1N6CMD8_9SPHN|nr:MOSC domain-containing protein [Parasphingorhabdus marina]SIN59657.1 MOSC domain-containing protein [Parasphingorhabdus marina DSM 22363]